MITSNSSLTSEYRKRRKETAKAKRTFKKQPPRYNKKTQLQTQWMNFMADLTWVNTGTSWTTYLTQQFANSTSPGFQLHY